jgi:hypothetical protein
MTLPALGFGLSLTFTTTGLPGSPIDLDSILEIMPPPQQAEVAKYTPLNGADQGKEKIAVGKTSAVQSTLKVPHTAERYEALAALFKLLGTYALTLADGTVLSATGAMSKIGLENITDTALVQIAMTFELEGGWTPTAPAGS